MGRTKDPSADVARDTLSRFGARAPASAWTQALVLSRFLRVAYVLARLELPELLAEGPADCAALAEKTGADRAALLRVLRVARLTGIVRCDERGCFTLTPTGDLLRAGAAGSVRQRVIEAVEAPMIPHDGLLHSVKTGRPSFDLARGMSFFDYMREHEDVARKFDANMTLGAGFRGLALLSVLPPDARGTMVDVGGGSGRLLAEVLAERESLRGIVFDLPETIRRTASSVDVKALGDRIELASGSFFESVPAGGDYYVLSFVLHDWDDARSVAILDACRRSIAADGRLYVIEDAVRPGPEDDFVAFLKLGLLELVGAGERTECELRQLLALGGFDVVAVHRFEAAFAVLEARGTPAGDD